jgi:hypothetical protein
MKNLADTVKFTKEFWKRLIGGRNFGLIKMIIKRVQKDGKNYKDEKFAPYAESYAEAKGSGDKKRLNLQGQRQESKSTKPDMTLTNKMLWGLQPYEMNDNGIVFGWEGPNAEKVANLHGKKNYQIIGLNGGKTLSDAEEQHIYTSVDEFIGDNLKSWSKETIEIKLGK